MGESQHMINRRTVTKGIAWSVPVVAVAGAAPAFATSGPRPTITLKNACKSPGNSCKVFEKGYRINAEICNTGSEPIWIYSFTYTSDVALTLVHTQPSLPYKVEANDCADVVLEAAGSNSGNQKNFTVTTTSRWGHTPIEGDDPDQAVHNLNPMVGSQKFDSTPPDCACEPYGNPVPLPDPAPDVEEVGAEKADPVAESAPAESTEAHVTESQITVEESKPEAPVQEAIDSGDSDVESNPDE